jgi:putative ABC transport system substrate-binding protein
MFDKRRREFITLLVGVGATWPLTARAQQSERMRRIGVLMPLAADDPHGQARIAAFVSGLHQLGWIVGQNIRIDTRWSAGNADVDRERSRTRSARCGSPVSTVPRLHCHWPE